MTFDIDWDGIFVPDLSLLEVLIRGSVTYLALFVVMRFFRRQSGALGISDFLVVILMAEAASSALLGASKSVTEGVLQVCVIAGWDQAIDALAFYVPATRKLLRPAPLLLIKDGALQRRNMRKELITLDELRGQLREQGVEHIADVKCCFMENDGAISVIKKDDKAGDDDVGGADQARDRVC